MAISQIYTGTYKHSIYSIRSIRIGRVLLCQKTMLFESFELDHTLLKAPLCASYFKEVGPKGDDIITNFDIR